MARQLPHIKAGASPKNELPAKKRFHRNSSFDCNPQKTRINKMIESRLAKQFQYFRAEFLEHALSIGIPVPLDMVEDKNGKVMTFVNQKGPRYLLNIIHGYPESVHLLRSSLSFLIVIMSILTQKISFSQEIECDNRISLMGQNIQAWAREALNSIADSSSVAICTNLLRHSHSETIQELVLNLLAQLVRTSSEAAAQMMHRPHVSTAATNGSDPQGNHKDNSNPSTPRNDNNSGTTNPDEMTCLSYMFSVVSHNRNRYTVMTSCAEVCLALLKDKSEEVSEAMARSRVNNISIKKVDESNTKDRYIGRDQNEVKTKTKQKQKASKCKTLAVLTRKNPTTALARGSVTNKAAPPSSPQISARRKNEKVPEDEHPNEWGALKVLLKFLHRFMRYGTVDDSVQETQHNHSQVGFMDKDEMESLGDGSARENREKNAPKRTSVVKDDIVPHKHKKALYTAHSRVLHVVTELVINSTAVAKYLLSMPGACAILKASCDMHKGSDISNKVQSCLVKLQAEAESLFNTEMKQHHSKSFEMTHGKSAKLFNPVSPISRRDTAMLRPERCGIPDLESYGLSNLDNKQQQKGVVTGLQSTASSPTNRPRSRGMSVMFAVTAAGGLWDEFSRPSSRSNMIPSGRLFSAEEKKYENKRIQMEQDKMYEKDFNESMENDENEDCKLEDDAWFLNSFEYSDDLAQQGKKKKRRPPPIETTFDSSRPASTSRSSRPVSSQRPRSPVPPYNPPESPKRRGLGPHNGGLVGLKDPSESLHRSLFTSLPEKPDMPVRLEADDIINDSNINHKNELLERSLTVTSSVVNDAYRDGFYRDGKNNVPISERARRAYVPDMPPFPGDDRHPHFVTEEYLEEVRNRPKSHQSVVAERSAKLRAHIKSPNDRKAKNRSLPNTPSRQYRDESYFNDAFSDYYQGLLPLNGVGEIEADSDFKLFLISKQQDEKRAQTAPSTVRDTGGNGMASDSLSNYDIANVDERTRGHASYASSLSVDSIDKETSLSNDGLDDTLKKEEKPPLNNQKSNGQLVQSVDMLFP